MIETMGLTKAYDGRAVVEDLSFTVTPGAVTGFLGPNGAGKSTTMRMLVGLARPTAGTSTVNGRKYVTSPAPMQEVGAMLDAGAFAPGRSARAHLRSLASTHGLPRSRVEEVLGLVGLQEVAERPAGGFSLGMSQRLGLATALLGDPATLILDEPVNGLDPEGIVWIRTLLKSLAEDGRTVLVSSHLMSEMALTAERLIVVGRGRLIAQTTVAGFVASAGGESVRVVTPEGRALLPLLVDRGGEVVTSDDGALLVTGLTSADVGELAAQHGVVLHELVPVRASLEEAFMDLTSDAVEYRSSAAQAAP